MATLWLRQTEQCRYEVRSAGNSIRLYTDGVFHSQWNSRNPLMGHLWDLLFLPALYRPRFPDIKNALVLGIGGGSIINLLEMFARVGRYQAVDLDENHIFVAEKYFNVPSDKVDFHCKLAQEYLKASKKKFDFIIEDLFMSDGEDVRNAVRAIDASEEWLKSLANRLTVSGVLVMNFESSLQLLRSLTSEKLVSIGFKSLIQLRLPRYENAIAVLSKQELDVKVFQRNVEILKEQNKKFTNSALGFSQQRLL